MKGVTKSMIILIFGIIIILLILVFVLPFIILGISVTGAIIEIIFYVIDLIKQFLGILGGPLAGLLFQ